MDIYRFVIQAYPSSDHPDYHEWQKATLVLFIAGSEPYSAEQKSLLELEKGKWIPESYTIKDILIEEKIKEEGGAILEAYLEAKNTGVYILEILDDPVMKRKDEIVWGTGPKLNESLIDELITSSGGRRVTREEAGNFQEKNADYILGHFVLELKQFEQEGLAVPTRQEKVAKIINRYNFNNPVQKINPSQFNESDFREYLEIVGVPIQKRIKAASKQVKSTLNKLNGNNYGGVILLNTGYLTIPHELLISMAQRYASKDTSSISEIIVISSWTVTNGFDTVVNYAFHPNKPSDAYLIKLRDTFWKFINEKMTQMVTNELDISIGMQQPMSPTYFKVNDKAYTYGIPKMKSSLRKKK